MSKEQQLQTRIDGLSKKATAKLLEDGFSSSDVNAITPGKVPDSFTMANSDDEVTQEWMWVECITCALRAQKYLKEKNIAMASEYVSAAGDWFFRSSIVIHANHGHADKAQRQKNAKSVNQPYAKTKAKARQVAADFIRSGPSEISKAIIVEHVGATLIQGHYKTPNDERLWKYLTEEKSVIPDELRRPGPRAKK